LSIIAGNTNGDVGNSMTSLGYNLIGTGNGFTATGDQKGVTNPMLGALADNGGPTKTHLPLVGSPAIDTGNPTFNPANPDGNPSTNDAMPFDQRGAPFGRVYDGDGAGGARIDKGAVELQTVAPAVMGDFNQDGMVDGGDYLLWRKTQGATGLTPYTGADGSGNGVVDQADIVLWRFHFGWSAAAAGSGAGSGVDAELGVGNLEVMRSEERGASGGSELRILDFGLRIEEVRELSGVRDAVAVEGGVAREAVSHDAALLAWLESVGRDRVLASDEAPALVSGEGAGGECAESVDLVLESVLATAL
jgi:hypothetical protein